MNTYFRPKYNYPAVDQKSGKDIKVKESIVCVHSPDFTHAEKTCIDFIGLEQFHIEGIPRYNVSDIIGIDKTIQDPTFFEVRIKHEIENESGKPTKKTLLYLFQSKSFVTLEAAITDYLSSWVIDSEIISKKITDIVAVV